MIIVFENGFLNITTKTLATKAKPRKMDYIKSINLCSTKETINRVKRKSMECDVMLFAKHILIGD